VAEALKELQRVTVDVRVALARRDAYGDAAAWDHALALAASNRAFHGDTRPTVEREMALIRAADIFDDSWYAQRVGVDDAEALSHYVHHGEAVNIDPLPLFDSSWYLAQHPDALVSWNTPLAHFIDLSAREPVDPHPVFKSRWYAQQYLHGESLMPLAHYLHGGWREGCEPNEVFDSRWYAHEHSAVMNPDMDPLSHYVSEGLAKDFSATPWYRNDDARLRLGVLAGDPVRELLAQIDGGVDVGAREYPSKAAVSSDVESVMKWEYLTRGLHRVPDTFVLYRIIGNDLPPRHQAGQTLENVRFVLEHEPAYPGLEKRWVLNRIVDREVEQSVIELLDEYQQPYLRIAFIEEEYREASWNFEGFDPPGLTYGKEYEALDASRNLPDRVIDHVYHRKNLYVMNNNGARNAALRDGRDRAKWVLPWDGNCYLTPQSWAALVAGVQAGPEHKYFTVPMARVLDNADLLNSDHPFVADEEPQLLFRRDASEEFDENYRYGRRPKVELFWRLGIPGPWDTFSLLPWEPDLAPLSPEAGQVASAGWVARLYSGQAALEKHLKGRGVSRLQAIKQRIDRIDSAIANAHLAGQPLMFMDGTALADQVKRYQAGDPSIVPIVDRLIGDAESTLGTPVPSVVAKTTVAPSGDPQDYWHPAPYWWPNPATKDGLPFLRRDGERVPGTQFGEVDAVKYDRSSLQQLIDEVTMCALTAQFVDHPQVLERARQLLHTWFIDPATRMNPHLMYSQVRRGHQDDQGHATGIIEASDFYYLLDAVRMLDARGVVSAHDSEALRRWFGDYRDWLHGSRQGRGERSSTNNHGTWFDVQAVAIDAYLGNTQGVLDGLRVSYERVGQQFAPDGSQPEELRRSQSKHYCTYNLQGWMVLARFAHRSGQDLATYVAPNGASLAGAVQWLLSHQGMTWPHEQIESFDERRIDVLAACAVAAGLGWAVPPGLRPQDPWQQPPVFSPHDAVRPYWMVAGP
jgi:hypothetical protein